MGTDRRTSVRVAFALFGAVLACAPASGQMLNRDKTDKALAGVGVEENRLGAMAPLDTVFTDSNGKTVRLGDYFTDDKPVILSLVYYRCPVVCPVTLAKMAETFNNCDYTVGKDFRVVTISFDPSENQNDSMNARSYYTGKYTKAELPAEKAATTWSFHTGDETNIERLTEAVGFDYTPLDNGEFAHAVALIVCSPDGRVARYMPGLEQDPKQLKLALLDASEGKIADSIGDRILHYCYRFDPDAGEYPLQAMNVMRLAGGATVVFLTVCIGGLILNERRRRHAAARRNASGDHNARRPARPDRKPALGGTSS